MGKYKINPHTGALDRVDDPSKDEDSDNIFDKAESLDDGEGNQVSASEAKSAVDDAHSHSNKSELDLVSDGDHDVRIDNPHSVTKTQVGLGNVDNKSEETIIADVKADADIADVITKKHNRQHSIVNTNDHSDKTDYIDTPLSATILTGAIISEGSSAGTIKIGSLTALIRTTDSETGSLTKISLSEQDNKIIPSIDTIYKIILKYNGGSPTAVLQINDANGNNEIGIGHCMKDASNNVHFCNCGRRLSDGMAKLHKRQRDIDEIKLASGCAIGEIGTRNITISSGIIYEGINRLSPFSEGNFDSSGSDTFTYFYRDGASGWIKVAGQTQIDNVNYDNDSGVLEPLLSNQYGIHWVYLHPDDEHVYIVYGQDSYRLAQIASASPPSVLPTEISDFAVLIGRIIIKKNSATFQDIQTVLETTFNPAGVENHNELSNLQGGTTGQYYHLNATKYNNNSYYEDRGDPSTYDFIKTDFTTDGNWHDLDLSSIIPEETVLVHVRVRLSSSFLAGLQFRKKGNSNTINVAVMKIQVAGVYYYEDFLVACDNDRKIQYLASNLAWTALDFSVRGWFKK